MSNTPPDPSHEHLLARIRLLDDRIAAAIGSAERSGLGAGRLPGIYLTRDDVGELLDRSTVADPAQVSPEHEVVRQDIEASADRAEAAGATIRLRELTRHFDLLPLDVELLLVALGPELDERYERLLGYLADDLTIRRPTIGVALRLVGADPSDPAGRARLRPGGALVDGGLVELTDLDRPFLGRTVRVPDRVVMHLLGDDTADPRLEPYIIDPSPNLAGDTAALVATLRRGATLTYVRERRRSAASSYAAAALHELGLPALVLRTERLTPVDADVVGRSAVREARLRGAGLVAGPVDGLGGQVGRFCAPGWPVILTGRVGWDPGWSDQVPLSLEAPTVTTERIGRLWGAILDRDTAPDLDVTGVVAGLDLQPDEVLPAATAAWWHASHLNRPIGRADLLFGVRSRNASSLERLARRIEPSVGWPDLVLPSRPLQLLRELTAHARNRTAVLDGWAMRQGGGRGGGIAALFTGPSGTGKTLSAEVIAGELGVDLYTVDLATIVDKYIGETEKNLERVFSEAERVNGVLFFDEADALFGKRSEVRDAHDRYANVETAYLLQRMEAFEGIVILASNLSANLDDAFARRLDAIVEFPAPDIPHRRQIWERALRPGVPRAGDVDLDELARRFDLCGGNIRNIALAAAYFASEDGRPVAMRDLMRGAARELLKLGRLVHTSDFAPYEAVLL